MAIPAMKVVDSVSKPSHPAAKAAAPGGRKVNAAVRAGNKFRRWVRALVEVREQQHTPLVELADGDGDGDGFFEPGEFNLVPTQVLESYRWIFEEAREALDAMEEDLDQACRVREAAEKRA